VTAEIVIAAALILNLMTMIIGFSKLNREVGELKAKLEMHINFEHKKIN